MDIRECDSSFCDLLPDGVMLLDAEGRIIYANQALADILGRPLSEIIGKHCYEVVHGTQKRPPFCVQAQMELRQESVWEEFYEPHLGVWVWAYAAPIRNREGEIVGCFHLVRNITQEKRSLIGNHLFEKIVETIPGFFYLSDRHHRILFANQKFKEWVGEEPLGKKCYEIIYGRKTPCSWCRQQEVFEKGQTVTWEARCPRDGRWYLAINAPFDPPTGERLKITLIFDIDHRKRLEEKLNRLFDENPAGIFISDWEGHIHLINPALRRLLGIPPDLDPTQLKVYDFYVRPEERTRLLKLLENRKEVSGYEVEIRDYQGRHIWVTLTAKLVEEEGRRFIWGSLQDITPLKEAEQALAESEARFRALAENAPLGVILMDERGKITYFNPAAEKIFGYKAEEVLGKDLHLTLAPPKYHDNYLRSFAEVLRTGKSKLAGKRLEFEALRKDGSTFPAEIFFSIIESQGKRLYLGLVQDISQRKKMEEERLQIEKHRALELLAGGIAHDFNNLLASLMGNIELASRLTQDERLKNILRRTEKVAREARDLARDLLTFSKGDIPIPEEVDLKTFVGDLARFLLHGSAIRLHLEIPEEIPPVKIDPTHLAQALQNLILNAKEAMPEGGEIFIQAAQVDSKVVIVIRDTGPGIPEEVLPRIFEPGFTTKPAGTGIGLSVVRSVVERYGGEVKVQSEPGKGTAFKLILPAGRREEKEKVEEMEGVEESLSFQGRILVMDDEEPIRELLSEALELMGLEVETAQDGEEAVSRYRKALKEGRPFDLVILDLTVPGGKGGLWTLEKLKELNPEVKAVLSTGYTVKDFHKDQEEAPFVDFLRKPYTIKELIRLLKKHLPEKP